ncbi:MULTISPECIES: PBP1A family penicillin-binding protein [unclassified Undibacterium]|uniref:penicillin-binding protein 1A n=1 Tax=unclassified Undibacterium TaxID=2630295 RepID=UPI002AC98289|nr:MULTISPECIES: PBP1A family penicillin-binding protein [unclassified Undibacterium]MEB0140855.1 PBP1A family penicillin-binding protein [Undibacterium sp. CCC2.1]MEB0173833.1 PBP1A family penicillin-binding protein [Undibacterium sp. CCC1.1]MEB0177808.1 PBP1A family penicillin-binding protein [Undibacterium sp. CCC3.4]MEB0216690.1 PBP1A family penicillin-binding protein [Undibacterium sp. 5I2]WPX44372.1 PBP1A family penicillin-binding protein [Undibacterium sp. CCC3.4]
MKWLLAVFLALGLAAASTAAYVLLVVVPDLPALDAVTDYQPKIPLRIYTADNALIGEFGDEHRDFVAIADIPAVLKNALLSIEDARFYEHHGVDFIGLSRALLADLSGGFHQGASTITMQVARNFFLSQEKTINRKIREILLTFRIEAALSKDQILELYMNQIYLGQRTHGFSSAAKTYFGKPLNQLSLAEAAMLAGIPQNPVRHNPAVNPQRAKERQILVLKSMLRKDLITPAQFEQASHEHLTVTGKQQFDAHADYAAEMVRQVIVAEYKEAAYTSGIRVTTTLLKADQDAAWEAVRKNVMEYDQRHGYRGPETRITLPSNEDERDDAIDDVLRKYPSNERLLAAVVTAASGKTVAAELASGESIEITGEGLRFAAAALQSKAKAELKIAPGALIRVIQDSKKRWSISQLPEVEGAYVALNADSGAYRALVGGFDFNRNKFNHVSSAWRQPGSSLKPFIYSAALEKGFAPATLINDVQLSATTDVLLHWDPRNDDNKYDGPISLRTALAQSKNVASVRVLKAIGVATARDWLPRFGFSKDKHPDNLTLALGTGAVTPLQLAGAYAVFANGGFQVKPWLISKVTDSHGKLLSEAKPALPALEENRVIDSRNAFVMDSLLREVTRSGTGAAASVRLGRHDLAGKTGTSSEAVDGWFAGYAANVVAVAWMGYDDPKSLGGREFGATLALPIWIDSMRASLAGKAESKRTPPDGVLNVEGDWVYSEFQNGAGVKTLDLEETAPLPVPG